MDDIRPNQNAPLMLNFVMTIDNNSGFNVAGNKTIYLIALNEVEMITHDGEFERVLVTINSEKLLDPNNKIMYDRTNAMNNVVSGGSFFGDLWIGIKKVASNVLPTISKTARSFLTPVLMDSWRHRFRKYSCPPLVGGLNIP